MTLSFEFMFNAKITIICMLGLGCVRLVLAMVEKFHPLAPHSVQRPRPAYWTGRMIAIYVLNAFLIVGMFALWHLIDVERVGLLARHDLLLYVEEHDISSMLLGGLLFWVTYSFFDGCLHYWRHYSNTLWVRIHRIHHNDPAMDVTTTYWRGFPEIVFDLVGLVFLAAVVLGVSWPILVLGMTFEVFAQLIHHTNFKSPKWIMATLGRIIQLPEHHRYHHAVGLHCAYYWTIMPFNVMFDVVAKALRMQDVGVADIDGIGDHKTGFVDARIGQR